MYFCPWRGGGWVGTLAIFAGYKRRWPLRAPIPDPILVTFFAKVNIAITQIFPFFKYQSLLACLAEFSYPENPENV